MVYAYGVSHVWDTPDMMLSFCRFLAELGIGIKLGDNAAGCIMRCSLLL